MRNAAIVVLMLIVTAPVFGEQSSLNPQATMRFGALRAGQSKDPYQQLFAAQQALKGAQQQSAATAQQPKVVCGMMIIPADPTIDPKMRITPPQDSRVEYKIRVVEPTLCWEKK